MASPSTQDFVRQQRRRLRKQQIRRRRLTFLAVVLAIVVIVVVIIVTAPDGQTQAGMGASTSTTAGGIYTAELTGDQEVPPVETASTGRLTLTVDGAGSRAQFVLEINGLQNASVARIYEGRSGEDGDAVVTLFTGPTKPGPFVGVLAEGTITDADLTGPLAGKTLQDLLDLIEEGSAYISIGTLSYPEGAIRGQLRAGLP